MRTVLTVLGLAAFAGSALAQQPAKRPAGLDAVPADGFAFVSVNVGQVWDADALKPLKEALLKTDGSPLKEAEKHLGLSVADIDRVTLLWPTLPTGPRNEQPFIIVTTMKPYNEAKLLAALKATATSPRRNLQRLGEGLHNYEKAFPPPLPKYLPKDFPPGMLKDLLPYIEQKELFPPPDKNIVFPDSKNIIKKYLVPSEPPPETAPPPKKEPKAPEANDACQPKPEADGGDTDAAVPDLFYLPTGEMAVFLLDDTTFLFLPLDERNNDQLVGLLKLSLRKKAAGPLSDALALAGKHAVIAGIDFRPVRAQLTRERELPRNMVPFRSLLKLSRATATLDVGATTKVAATLMFPAAEEARKAEPVLKTLFQVAADELAKEKKFFAKDAERIAVIGPLYDMVLGALDKSDVKQDGAALVAMASAEIGEPLQKVLAALPAYVKFQAEEVRTLHNLKQIGIALHSYHDANGFFPTDVLDPVTKKPILSWRVQLLPYLEQDNLFRQIDMTKPWDDEKNVKLLAKTPTVFSVFGREAKEGMTYLQMFAGEKAIEGGTPLLMPGARRRMTDITDGLTNTFGVVEAGEAANWAKPGDIRFDPKKLPALGNPKTGKFAVLMLDGAAWSFRRDKITDDQLRAFITTNGGEVNTFEFGK